MSKSWTKNEIWWVRSAFKRKFPNGPFRSQYQIIKCLTRYLNRSWEAIRAQAYRQGLL